MSHAHIDESYFSFFSLVQVPTTDITLHICILALVLCGLTGVRFNEMSIDSAAFLGNGTEVVVGGRKPFFFSYDTTSGAISKIPGESAAAHRT